SEAGALRSGVEGQKRRRYRARVVRADEDGQQTRSVSNARTLHPRALDVNAGSGNIWTQVRLCGRVGRLTCNVHARAVIFAARAKICWRAESAFQTSRD